MVAGDFYGHVAMVWLCSWVMVAAEAFVLFGQTGVYLCFSVAWALVVHSSNA